MVVLVLLAGFTLGCSQSRGESQPGALGFKAFSTGWMGKIVVANPRGETIVELPYTELMKIHGNAVDGSILGWSDDGNYAWFQCNMDAVVVLFGRIDVVNKTWTAFKKPKRMPAYQIAINYNNGDVVYSDYPFQFDTQSAAETKRSGKEFHLYRNNFLRPQAVLLATNKGQGFEIRREADQRFSYRTSEDDSFHAVRFE